MLWTLAKARGHLILSSVLLAGATSSAYPTVAYLTVHFLCVYDLKKKKYRETQLCQKMENQNRIFESYKDGLKLILMLLNKKPEYQIS